MDKFTVHTGTGVALRRSNVDTDQIIPAVYLKRIIRTGFDDALFAAWRTDPAFVLNQPDYEGASVLLAGPEFGTGSSREHAVWALRDYGFKAVISPRFADIFRGNAMNNGLLAITLPEPVVNRLMALVEQDPGTAITIDLERRRVLAADVDEAFEIDDNVRHRLLNGLDDIDVTLAREDLISSFEATRALHKPATLPVPAL